MVVLQPAHRGHIPDGTAPDLALSIALGSFYSVLHQIGAEGILIIQPLMELRAGGGKGRNHAHAGKDHQGRTDRFLILCSIVSISVLRI